MHHPPITFFYSFFKRIYYIILYYIILYYIILYYIILYYIILFILFFDIKNEKIPQYNWIFVSFGGLLAYIDGLVGQSAASALHGHGFKSRSSVVFWGISFSAPCVNTVSLRWPSSTVIYKD